MKGIYYPKTLELSDVRHVKVSMIQKARSQFMLARKQAISADDSIDCFSLQIAIVLS